MEKRLTSLTSASSTAKSWKTHRDEGLRLAKLANQQPLTLLYAAKDTQQNHALVLAEWLKSLI